MKKVLIISYFYPPCNLTAGQRTNGWANYLSDSDYHPIVVTRNWDIPIKSTEDVLRSTGSSIQHTETAEKTVYYLPYKAGIRDRFYTKFQGSPLQKISKLFTLVELILENFTTRFIPHRNLYTFSRQLLKSDPEIKKVIISANPFNLFHFGYLLKREFDIEWIADYRDDWNTSEIEVEPKKGIASFIKKLQISSEKKWLKNARFITSVSPHYVHKISKFVGKEGFVILNGYDIDRTVLQPNENRSIFSITYNGSLYNSQPIELFLEAVGKMITHFKDSIEIQLNFPGLAFDKQQAERVMRLTFSYKDQVKITDRISKEEVLRIQNSSDLLVMISHRGIKGVPSSKLYEYIGLEKPILLFPDDQDIIHETIKDAGLGFICNSAEEIATQLKTLIDLKKEGQPLIKNIDPVKIDSYSRKNQTKVLAGLLDKM